MRLPAWVITSFSSVLDTLLQHRSFSSVQYSCVSYEQANRPGILESR